VSDVNVAYIFTPYVGILSTRSHNP